MALLPPLRLAQLRNVKSETHPSCTHKRTAPPPPPPPPPHTRTHTARQPSPSRPFPACRDPLTPDQVAELERRDVKRNTQASSTPTPTQPTNSLPSRSDPLTPDQVAELERRDVEGSHGAISHGFLLDSSAVAAELDPQVGRMCAR